jgi:hypothetical protein
LRSFCLTDNHLKNKRHYLLFIEKSEKLKNYYDPEKRILIKKKQKKWPCNFDVPI